MATDAAVDDAGSGPSESPLSSHPDSGTSDGGLNRSIPRQAESFLRKRGGLLDGEEIKAVVGKGEEALICTGQRLVVVKVGLAASSTGGGRVTAFPLAEVTALQRQIGFMFGTLSVQSPGYGATQTGDFWATGKDNWQKFPNVIVWDKARDRTFAKEIAYIEQRIVEARSGPLSGASQSEGRDTAGQLERLAALHKAGALSDEEFAASKRNLLGLD